MTAVNWLIEQIETCKIFMYNDGVSKKLISLSDDDLIEQAKQMEAEQQEKIAVEFAEWVLINEHIDTIWSTPKKELFQEFLKTK